MVHFTKPVGPLPTCPHQLDHTNLTTPIYQHGSVQELAAPSLPQRGPIGPLQQWGHPNLPTPLPSPPQLAPIKGIGDLNNSHKWCSFTKPASLWHVPKCWHKDYQPHPIIAKQILNMFTFQVKMCITNGGLLSKTNFSAPFTQVRAHSFLSPHKHDQSSTFVSKFVFHMMLTNLNQMEKILISMTLLLDSHCLIQKCWIQKHNF